MSNPPNYLEFLYELDRYTRDSPRGCVPDGATMHLIARDAGLAGPTDTSAAAWTGQLITLKYLIPGTRLGGERRPEPPPGAWTDDELQRYIDYQVTDQGRDEAERIRRLRRQAATDAALGIAPSWLDESQLEAVGTQLRSLRSALDEERWVDAVGAAKNLVEASCKVTLAQAGQDVARSESLPTLFKKAYDALGVPTEPAAIQLGRRLTGTAKAVGELRTVTGAGHGQAEASAITARDARLAAAAAVAISRYLLEPASPD